MKIQGNIVVGKPDVSPDTPAHTPGVREGNAPHNKQEGIHTIGGIGKGTAARSTGINAKNRNPIDPRMPNLSPA